MLKINTPSRYGILVCNIASVVMGISTPLIGVTYGNITERYGMLLQDAGIFSGLQALGSAVIMLFVGRLADRINMRWLLAGALLLMGTSLLVLALTPIREIAFLSTFLFGVGTGAMLLLPNVAVARLAPESAARGLLILGFSYGLGGILGPQIVSAALGGGNFLNAYYISAGLSLFLTIPFLLVSVPLPHQKTTAAGAVRRAALPPIPVLLPFIILIGVYVGTEVGTGNWMTTHVRLVAGATEQVATLATSAFWLGLTFARGIASFIAGRLREETILRGSLLLLAAALTALLLFGQWEVAAVICAFFAGMGCAPIFPTTFAIVQRLFPDSFGAVSGLLLTAGSTSVIILPWLQGQIGGGRDGGMILPLFGSLVILAITLLVTRETRRQDAASAAHPASTKAADR